MAAHRRQARGDAAAGARARSGAGEDVDLDHHEAGQLPSADEQVASFDLLTRSAEALQRLKPQELRALWLKAQGHSYAEIAALEGWTYTKVNRCITEGRRSFLDRYAEIDSGGECRRWEGMLSALADGEAAARDVAAVRPHLRNCPACRATSASCARRSRGSPCCSRFPPSRPRSTTAGCSRASTTRSSVTCRSAWC